jgi:hypothetical protein
MSNHDLSQLLHELTPEPPVSVEFDRVGKAARRRRRWTWAGAAIAVALVVGGAVALPSLFATSGPDKIVPAGPSTQAKAAPTAVETAAQGLRADVVATGAVKEIWVRMTWTQWKQLDTSSDAPSDARNGSKPVYVVQAQSDKDMECVSCKGLHPVKGRFATLVVPVSPGMDTVFTVGDQDFGISTLPGVQVLLDTRRAPAWADECTSPAKRPVGVNLIGLTFAQASSLAHDRGLHLRVMGVGGHCVPVTPNLVPNEVGITIDRLAPNHTVPSDAVVLTAQANDF